MFIKDFDNLKCKPFSKEFNEKGYVRNDSGLNYIGFPLDPRFKKDDPKPQRRYIIESQTFNVTISFHPMATEDDKKKFFATLWLAFNLGNFGSRARRGFGSIKINSIKNHDINNFYKLSFNPKF